MSGKNLWIILGVVVLIAAAGIGYYFTSGSSTATAGGGKGYEIVPTDKTLGDPKSTAIVWKPQTEVPVTGETVTTLMKLFDALDAEDDVQQVYSNEDISEEDMVKYGG